MFKTTMFLLACLSVSWAYTYVPYEQLQDENGQQYYVVPLVYQQEPARVRRDTDYGYGTDGAYVSHTATLINNDDHKLDANAFAHRQYLPKGPLTTGHGVDYTYKPSDSTLSVATQNTRGQGTDLSASGQYNFFKTQDGRGKVGAYGEYSRHYGGASGTLSPQWSAGVRGSYDF